MILLKKIFWVGIFVVSLFFVVIYFQRYLVSREWHKAVKLFENEKYVEAENIYSNLYPKMNWSGRFLAWYADVEMRLGKYESAIELYEKAKFTYPSPYLFEALGVGYMNYQSGIERKLQKTKDKKQKKKINQNNPLNSPGIMENSLTRRECMNKAVHNWMIAGNILPWRLTSKFYLADFFYQVGELDEAVKYAKLVVDTPMKKWTKRGEDFKLKSATILMELGVECDDPGIKEYK